MFETARASAPCVLFLDELDAIGQKRSQLRNSSGTRNVVVQLLSELDGVATTNDGVYVLGASNHPWDVDVALRRHCRQPVGLLRQLRQPLTILIERLLKLRLVRMWQE